jgi:hypothetical protein
MQILATLIFLELIVGTLRAIGRSSTGGFITLARNLSLSRL